TSRAARMRSADAARELLQSCTQGIGRHGLLPDREPRPLERVEQAELQVEALAVLPGGRSGVRAEERVRLRRVEVVIADERREVEQRVVVAGVFPVDEHRLRSR